MGTKVASDLIAQASELAQDETNVVWETAQALAWLNDAQQAIAVVRPDASVLTHSVTLTPGTKQSITGRRLFSVIRNMGIDGVTPGRGIRLVERGIKDEFEPNWHTETASTEVKEYIFDARTPKEFYVSPPVHATTIVQVELAEAVNPTEVATTASAITIDDVYTPALLEWMLYRFFARDAEETPNFQRAIRHFQSFFALLGEKAKIDMATNPKFREQLS